MFHLGINNHVAISSESKPSLLEGGEWFIRFRKLRNLRDSGNSEKLRDTHGACLPPRFHKQQSLERGAWGLVVVTQAVREEFKSFPDLYAFW